MSHFANSELEQKRVHSAFPEANSIDDTCSNMLPFSSEIQSADLIETDTACPSRLHHHHAAFTTHDRWPGWSTANIPGCACLMASYRHFALAALAKCYQPKIALPRPLTIHFPHCDLEASGGLYPLERMRMGSSGVVAFLLKRLCWQQPARASSYHQVLKLGSGVARRVYCRQANSEVEAAFLFDFENNSVDRGCQHRLFLQQMSGGDRARLLTAGVCRNILTQWHFDPNDEAIPDYDVFPPPVVAELADGFMRNLFENFSEGKLYSLGPKWQRFWQRGIRLMTQIRPLALETFVRTSFIVRLCDVILSEFLAMSRINCYEFRPKFYAVHGSSFPELCYMLSDILQLDASLVMPCALQLREILHPHWQHIPDSPRFGFRSLTFRSALEAVGCSPSAACSYSLTATHLLPFPIDQDAFRRRLNGLEHVEKVRARQFELAAADDSQCYNCRSFENAPQKKARFDAPVFIYIHRIATMLSQQLALNCVKVRVEATEGCSGLPGRDVECSAAHTFAHVLRCACALFGVSPSQWRIYKDKNRWHELPLEATLESFSISGYACLYLG